MATSRRILARLGIGAATVALASAPLAAMASTTPHTWTSCSNKGCNGQDPVASGCSQTFEARAIRRAPIMNGGQTVGWVELRWSPFCGNNWARVVSTSGSQPLTAVATRADGAKQWGKGTGTAVWTPMIFGRDLCVSATGWVGSAKASTSCG